MPHIYAVIFLRLCKNRPQNSCILFAFCGIIIAQERKAKRVVVCATFGLFTNGLDKFVKAYEEGIITKILTTNLVYQTPELLSKNWYISCDMSKYIAYIIDTLNHDSSISDLLNPNERIQNIVAKYKKCEL